MGGGGSVLLHTNLAKETLAAGRIYTLFNLLVGRFTIRTMRLHSTLEDFVVTPVKFVIG